MLYPTIELEENILIVLAARLISEAYLSGISLLKEFLNLPFLKLLAETRCIICVRTV